MPSEQVVDQILQAVLPAQRHVRLSFQRLQWHGRPFLQYITTRQDQHPWKICSLLLVANWPLTMLVVLPLNKRPMPMMP
jgi:hypothetical protein